MTVKFCVSAPGKVILHGEHSVVYGKTAIAASLGFRMYATFEENDTSKIDIHLPNFGLNEIIFEVDEILNSISTIDIDWKNPQSIDHEAHYAHVKSFILKNTPNRSDMEQQALIIILYLFTAILAKVEKVGFALNIRSDLTIGAGTGSSASYAVSIAGAFLHYLRIKCPNEYYSSFVKSVDNEFTDLEKKLISNWAFCSEKIAHGLPSGIDNSVCTYGSVIEFRKSDGLIPHNLKVQLKVILVNSKVSRQTKVLVKNVAVLLEKYPALISNIMNALDHVALEALKILQSLEDGNSDEIIEKYKDLSVLVDLNHGLLASLQVSHPALEKIRARASEYGMKCKLTGAGGGGYSTILVPPMYRDIDVENLIKTLNDDGFEAQLVNLGVPGVRVD